MQQARMDLKLSQKDVAQKVNEKPSILQDYESGKAIPNPQILGKLERVLGEIDGVKVCHLEFGAEADGLLLHVLDKLGALDAFGPAGKIFNQRGDG